MLQFHCHYSWFDVRLILIPQTSVVLFIIPLMPTPGLQYGSLLTLYEHFCESEVKTWDVICEYSIMDKVSTFEI